MVCFNESVNRTSRAGDIGTVGLFRLGHGCCAIFIYGTDLIGNCRYKIVYGEKNVLLQ